MLLTALNPYYSLFEIRWEKETNKLVIGIFEKAFEMIVPIMVQHEKMMRDHLKYKEEFFPYEGGKWGYEKISNPETYSYQPGFIYFSFRIPVRKKKEINWQRIHTITRTLASICSALSYISYEDPFVDEDLPETLVVPTDILTDYYQPLYGAAISGMVGMGAIKYFQTIPIKDEPFWRLRFREPGEAIQQVYERMSGHLRYLSGSFYADLDSSGKLHLNTFGNACGLDADWTDEADAPYHLAPHNTDSALQQLSLIVGLAAVSDVIRKNTPVPS